LFEKVTVGGMNLDPIKSRLPGIFRSPAVIGHDVFDLIQFEGVGRFKGHTLKVAGEGIASRWDRGRRYG